MSFSTDGALSIDVFHKGVFVPKPLMYFNPDKTSITEVDLRNLEFKDFKIYIRNLTKGMCHDMYYCLPNRALVDGLRELRDEDDYVRFLDAGYKNGRRISIYIDHDHEPLMQWIEEEIAEDGVYGDSDPSSDDVDSVMSDDISVDHEVDDEVIEIPKSVDPFLSKKNLIPKGGVDEEVDDEVHHFPIHDPDQKWDTMVPVLGMRFSDRYELKQMITNYAVFKGGELLAAIGRDSNNQMYPLAWAVVSVENKETWKWFLDLLLEDIGMGDGRGLTIISDQHKGLVEAVKERAPACEHRQCARHVYANFKKKYTGVEFRKLFWRAAKSTTESAFRSYMREINAMSTHAYDHLMERDPKTWCKAFFELDRCCDAMENGISESFNAAIVEARKKPIISMLEEVRVYVMERMYKQKGKGEKWNLDICPSIRRRIETFKEQQRYWDVTPSGPQIYEVRQLHEVYAVDLDQRTCGCRAWQLTGIPCVHGIAAIFFLNGNAEEYVAVWFTTNMFGSCYRYNVKPTNGADMWPETGLQSILPPRHRRMPGRPKVNRKKCRTEKEGKHTVSKKGGIPKCGNCHQEGHNRRRCPLLKQDEQLPEEVGSEEVVVAEEVGAEEEVVAEEVRAEEEVAAEEVGVEEQVAAEEVGVEEEVVVEEVVEQMVDDEQPNEEQAAEHVVAQHVQVVAKKCNRRKGGPSQRITKLKLMRKVVTKDGSGSSIDNPVTLI
ncbi:unnamed protein product [Lactuca saligna]|uniref:SWIM-type domain-containing protein n=1 Tax=Lactuca saligna TaxID=75948 RepID=A0AA35YES5_LACSI|nr:unnamed protein product [Lactuca saligna]